MNLFTAVNDDDDQKSEFACSSQKTTYDQDRLCDQPKELRRDGSFLWKLYPDTSVCVMGRFSDVVNGYERNAVPSPLPT